MAGEMDEFMNGKATFAESSENENALVWTKDVDLESCQNGFWRNQRNEGKSHYLSRA